MGEMIFLLPTGIDAACRYGLERACLAGGPESVPWPTLAVVESDRLILTREIGESGALHAPWRVDGSGRFMLSSCTLMERPEPYRLLVELTRGKLNQVRNQAWEWRAAGLEVPPDFVTNLKRAQQSFRTAISAGSAEVADLAAADSLECLALGGSSLVQAYIEQVFHLRRERPETLNVEVGCRHRSRPPASAERALLGVGKAATLAFPWKEIEPAPGTYVWDKADELTAWAEEADLQLTGGPLIDMGADGLPDWLSSAQRDVNHLARAMCRFIQTLVRRYHTRIPRWILTRGSNCSTTVQITEHAMLWLILRLAQTVRQVAPEAELTVAITRPWGDYLAVEDHEHSPFVFADTLARSEIKLAALEVELVMGLPGRESYLRDMLDTSRLLDYYSLLGTPLHVSLGYPSRVPADSKPETAASEGSWQEGATPAGQAAWGESFAALALCKPYVQRVSWICATDVSGTPLAGCGLCDELGQPKQIAQELGGLGIRYAE